MWPKGEREFKQRSIRENTSVKSWEKVERSEEEKDEGSLEVKSHKGDNQTRGFSWTVSIDLLIH